MEAVKYQEPRALPVIDQAYNEQSVQVGHMVSLIDRAQVEIENKKKIMRELVLERDQRVALDNQKAREAEAKKLAEAPAAAEPAVNQ